MELFETKIGNDRKPLYEVTRPEATYYTELQDNINNDDEFLPYCYKILDHI